MFLHLQYLVCLNQTFLFLLGAVCLCRYQHNNRTCVRTKTTVPRPSDGGGLGPVPNDRGLTPIRTNYQVYVGKKLRAKKLPVATCALYSERGRVLKMCKGLYGLATSCEMNITSPCSLERSMLLPVFTFVAPTSDTSGE